MKPLKALKLIKRVNDVLVRAKNINTSQNVVGQVLALIAYSIALFADFLPGEWRAVAVAVGALTQGVVGLLAHYSNPDATDITKPYLED